MNLTKAQYRISRHGIKWHSAIDLMKAKKATKDNGLLVALNYMITFLLCGKK